MTKKELEEYRSVVAEMDEVRERMKANTLSDTVTGSDTDYPFTAHTIRVAGITDNAARRRDALLLARLEKQKRKIEEFVHNIPDSVTRRIFTYRYIDGKVRPSWQWIAFKIGGGNSADAVRKIVSRYLIKNQKK